VVEMNCAPDLVVEADRLRLKQILLNLAMNSFKYVEHGYLRLSAEIVEGRVRLLIDDSGPGIPPEKRGRLFAKFQESLDLQDQGAGIGVCLSKQLVNLMGGDLFLDEGFDSGIENCPGTRFVVDLKRIPLPSGVINNSNGGSETESSVAPRCSDFTVDKKLPESLSALFVDDDVVLRKLFVRSLQKVAESWTVQEAGNGEAALRLCDASTFDVIFIDQYMITGNVEKPLLGTETVREMRSRGITAKICGLSANDVELDFLESGADAFIKKPYPCEKGALEKALVRVLFGSHCDESCS
jgi:CheY-like chemotaxis protein